MREHPSQSVLGKIMMETGCIESFTTLEKMSAPETGNTVSLKTYMYCI